MYVELVLIAALCTCGNLGRSACCNLLCSCCFRYQLLHDKDQLCVSLSCQRLATCYDSCAAALHISCHNNMRICCGCLFVMQAAGTVAVGDVQLAAALQHRWRLHHAMSTPTVTTGCCSISFGWAEPHCHMWFENRASTGGLKSATLQACHRFGMLDCTCYDEIKGAGSAALDTWLHCT